MLHEISSTDYVLHDLLLAACLRPDSARVALMAAVPVIDLSPFLREYRDASRQIWVLLILTSKCQSHGWKDQRPCKYHKVSSLFLLVFVHMLLYMGVYAQSSRMTVMTMCD